MILNKTFMITCRQSTEWIIKKEHGKLSVKENLQLLSHLAICSFCRLFKSQSLLITHALSKNERGETFHLTAEDKKELFRSIQNKIKR